MIIPTELIAAIESELRVIGTADLQKSVKLISESYMEERADNIGIIKSRQDALAYVGARMPATYGAIYDVMSHVIENIDISAHSILDAGAGSGAGLWAASEILDIDRAICLEREPEMITIGKKLLSIGRIADVEWKSVDLVLDDLSYPADIVLCSYVLNEMNDDSRNIVIDKLWANTNKLLIIIEPGTPSASRRLLITRQLLLNKGANIVAPCPHANDCGYLGADWCHFSCRVPRSKMHMRAKQVDTPYEDEKYCYLAVSRDPANTVDNLRVLRHPIINKGLIELEICAHDGIRRMQVRKKDGNIFKSARKANAGDLLLPPLIQ